MADLSGIEYAIANTVATAVFGPGYVLNTQAATLSGNQAILYRGWPVASVLDADLTAGLRLSPPNIAGGISHITVFAEPNMSRLTTRYPLEWFTPTVSEPTLTAAVNGASVTFGGTCSAGQVAGIAFGGRVLQTAYAYPLQASDNLVTVASQLAALIPDAVALGPTVTLPGSPAVVLARTVAVNQALLEVRRQMQGVRVTVWCPTPQIRDVIASAVDAGLAGLLDPFGNLTEFLTLPNSEKARLQYRSTLSNDRPGKDHLWRRDLCYMVEYGTTLAQAQAGMLFGGVTVQSEAETDALSHVIPVFSEAGQFGPTENLLIDANGDFPADATENVIGTP